jgi:predicted kinase
MQPPTLIVVSGAPATGKTTIARELSEGLGVPMVSKDALKESLFNSLGHSDREWSRRLGRASMGLLFDFVEIQLAAGRSVIAESNFYPHPYEDEGKIRACRERYGASVFEVHCAGAPEVVLSRYRQRQGSDERHPGHVMEPADYDELKARIEGGFFHPMALGGGLISVDTTDFEQIAYRALVDEVRQVLARR